MKSNCENYILCRRHRPSRNNIALVGILIMLFGSVFFLTAAGNSEPLIMAEPLTKAGNGLSCKQDNFIKFLAPLIDQVNNDILLDRAKLEQIEKKILAGGLVSPLERRFLQNLAHGYGLAKFEVNHCNELKKRVDFIPRKLALAQSANETGYGTSRFAREAHNYFGQWCFKAGCGLVPRQRVAGARHEVRKFTEPVESVRAYIHLLNTHAAYEKLRTLRSYHRQNKGEFSALDLVAGLEKYSERGAAYISAISAAIRATERNEKITTPVRA